MVNKQAELLAALAKYDRYLICSHENPDPDSIGSMLAMYQYLRRIGKKVWMMCADPIPDFPWPNMSRILPFQDIDYQTAIILDCEPERTGKLLPLIKKLKSLLILTTIKAIRAAAPSIILILNKLRLA